LGEWSEGSRAEIGVGGGKIIGGEAEVGGLEDVVNKGAVGADETKEGEDDEKEEIEDARVGEKGRSVDFDMLVAVWL